MSKGAMRATATKVSAWFTGRLPKKWVDWSAAVIVVGALVTAGAFVGHRLWPQKAAEPWAEQVDRTCDAGYTAMATALAKKGHARLKAEAMAEDQAAFRLYGLVKAAPVSALLGYRDFVRAKLGLAKLRDEAVSQNDAAAARRIDTRIAALQRTASADAQIMGFTICGQADPKVE